MRDLWSFCRESQQYGSPPWIRRGCRCHKSRRGWFERLRKRTALLPASPPNRPKTGDSGERKRLEGPLDPGRREGILPSLALGYRLTPFPGLPQEAAASCRCTSLCRTPKRIPGRRSLDCTPHSDISSPPNKQGECAGPRIQIRFSPGTNPRSFIGSSSARCYGLCCCLSSQVATPLR